MKFRCRVVVCALVLGTLPVAAQVRGTNGQFVQPAVTFKGVIHAVANGRIQLELPDGNTLEIRTTRKSKFQVAGKEAKFKDLSPGQTVEIEARHVLGVVEVLSAVVPAVAKPKPSVP